MPAVQIFQQLRERIQKNKAMLPAEKRAMFWFKDYSSTLTRWQSQQRARNVTFKSLEADKFTKQLVTANRVEPGFFYFYLYDPKLKDELPYYDKFPFTLVLSNEPQGYFMGLNFHYLDYYNRARLFDALYPLREGRKSRPDVRDIRMRLKASYQLLKLSTKYKPFKPCLKQYLVSHVQTPLMKVGASEWDIALFLPVESFEKHPKTYVWRESQKKF